MMGALLSAPLQKIKKKKKLLKILTKKQKTIFTIVIIYV